MADVAEPVLPRDDRCRSPVRLGQRCGHLTHGVRLSTADVVRPQAVLRQTLHTVQRREVGAGYVPDMDEVPPLPAVLEDTRGLPTRER